MSVSILEQASGVRLAAGNEGVEVARHEGNWYFDPSAVASDLLRVTGRTYTCPSKGLCYWVDFFAPDGREVRDVAWVYDEPKPGHELIRGRYGFYAGTRGATRQGE